MIINITNIKFLKEPVRKYNLYYSSVDASKFAQMRICQIIQKNSKKNNSYLNIVFPVILAEKSDPSELKFGLSLFGNVVPLDMLFFISKNDSNAKSYIQNVLLKHVKIDVSDPIIIPSSDYGWVVDFLNKSAIDYANKLIEFVRLKKNKLFSSNKIRRTFWLFEDIELKISFNYLLSEFVEFLEKGEIYEENETVN